MVRRALLRSLLFGGLLGCGSVYHVNEDPDGTVSDGDASDAQPRGPALVQSVGSDMGSSGTLAVSFATATRAGDLLVMFGATNATDLMSVRGAGTWSSLGGSTAYANIQLWYAIADGSPGPVEIVATGSNNEIWMNVSEWSGVQPSSPVAHVTGDNSGGSAIDPGALELAASSLVLFGFTSGADDDFGTPGAAWNAFGPITGPIVAQRTFFQVIDVPAGQSGSVEASVPFRNGNWDAAIVAFPVQ